MPHARATADHGAAWLPQAALRDGAVGRLLGARIGQWSAKWIAGGGIDLLDERTLEGAAPGCDAIAWQGPGEGVALGLPGPAPAGLAGLALDADLSGARLEGLDRQLVERLAEAMLDDLRRDLAGLFEMVPAATWRALPAAPAWVGALRYAFGPASRKFVLHLALAADRLARLRKSAIGAAPAAVALQPVAAGLAGQPIGLSARVGGCALSLAELGGLAAGDVLILDRAAGEPLDLVVDGAVKRGRCTLDQAGDRLSLQISNPLSE